MKKMNLVLTMPLLLLAACSAKVTGDKLPDFSDTRELKVSSDPLAGEINGAAWKIGRAVARINQNGEYSITLAGEGVPMTCGNTFPMAPHIAFTVPGTGSYPYSSSAGVEQRIVNVIFPSTAPGVIGSDNVLSSKSLIQIDSIQGSVVSAGLSALSPVGSDKSYSIAGKFQATVCSAVADMPIFIRQNGSSAFRVSYAEALKSNDGSTIEVRLMDHVPQKKCSTFSSWMMTETPIKYVSLRMPAMSGAFTIARGGVEYGDQGNSQGWSTDAFNGSGKVLGVSTTDVLISFTAKDFAAKGLEIEGALTTTICTPQ